MYVSGLCYYWTMSKHRHDYIPNSVKTANFIQYRNLGLQNIVITCIKSNSLFKVIESGRQILKICNQYTQNIMKTCQVTCYVQSYPSCPKRIQTNIHKFTDKSRL